MKHKRICHVCGEKNHLDEPRCLYCENDLRTRAASEDRRSTWALFGAALANSLVFVMVPGALTFLFAFAVWGENPTYPRLAILLYLFVWLVVSKITRSYFPENYSTFTSARRAVRTAITVSRDSLHLRGRINVLLFMMCVSSVLVVVGNWSTLWRRLRE